MRGRGAVVLTFALCTGALPLPAGGSAAAATPCSPWTRTTVATHLGVLENLLADGTGGMLVAAAKEIDRVRPDGHVTKLASIASPGQLLPFHGKVLAVYGDDLQSGAENKTDGGLAIVDPVTGAVTPYADGLTMPNGMAIGPNDDAYVTRDVGSGTGITRIPAAAPHTPQVSWSTLDDTNGAAIDPTGTYLYTDQTFTADSAVYRIPLADPAKRTAIAHLVGTGTAVPLGLDDLTRDGAGVLYIAANSGGEVIRLDPATGATCVLTTGLTTPSSVRFGGGPGWPATTLYVVGFDGTLSALTPPPGQVPPVDPTPAVPLTVHAGIAPTTINALVHGGRATVSYALSRTAEVTVRLYAGGHLAATVTVRPAFTGVDHVVLRLTTRARRQLRGLRRVELVAVVAARASDGAHVRATARRTALET